MANQTPAAFEDNAFFSRTAAQQRLRTRSATQGYHLGREDLVDSAAIVVTVDEVAEMDELSPFSSESMQEFVAFVAAGLPEVFLRSHSGLVDAGTQDEIRAVIDEVSDRSLQAYLRTRLMFLQQYAKAQEAKTARSADGQKRGAKGK